MNRNRVILFAAVVVICLFILLGVAVLRFVGRRMAGGGPVPSGPPVAGKPGRVLPGRAGASGPAGRGEPGRRAAGCTGRAARNEREAAAGGDKLSGLSGRGR